MNVYDLRVPGGEGHWIDSEDFQSLINAVDNGVLIKDVDGCVRVANEAMASLAGFGSAEELEGLPAADFFLFENGTDEDGGTFESVLHTRDDDTVPVFVSRYMLRGLGEGVEILVVRGVDEGGAGAHRNGGGGAMRSRDKLMHHAYHDYLTGLPNRYLFFDRLDQALYLADRFVHNVAVYFMDLNGFKAVNDEYGHAGGDAVLKESAARIRKCLRHTDTVARIGGDEFAVILPDLDDVREADAVAGKIVCALRRPFRVKGGEAELGVSIGISIYPFHGRKGVTLLRNADRAMYKAKESGMSMWVVYEPGAVKRQAGKKSKEAACAGAIGEVSERRKTLPLLSSIIDALPDAAVALDMSGMVIYANAGFAGMFALDAASFVGKHVLEAPGMEKMDDARLKSYLQMMRDTVDKGRGGPVELRFQRWDGREMHVTASGGVARDGHNNPTHLIAMLREIEGEGAGCRV